MMTVREALSYGLLVTIIMVIITVMMFYRLHRSKKFAENKIKAWFWTETGDKYYQFVPLEDNGIEIKAPKGHSCPRYFLDKDAIGWENYPDSPPMGMKFLQIKVPAIVWAENNPEPLRPRPRPDLVTSRLIDGISDENFAAFSAEAERQVHELELALAKSKANQLNPMVMYILVAGAMIAGIVSAVMVWQTSDAISKILRGLGL